MTTYHYTPGNGGQERSQLFQQANLKSSTLNEEIFVNSAGEIVAMVQPLLSRILYDPAKITIVKPTS